MKVYLLKDVERVGLAGEILTVADGYALNFLLPQKFGVQITPHNEAQYKGRIKIVEHRKEVVASKTSILAQRIGALEVKIKRPLHDDGKLYGAINAQEIVDGLAVFGVSISKNQVVFDKNIKEKGIHKVTIKLSSKLMPLVVVKVVAE